MIATVPFRNQNGKIEHRAQLSLSETSKLTGVTVSQLRKLCRNGVLNPVTGFGRKWYLAAEDLLRLFNHRLRDQTEAT